MHDASAAVHTEEFARGEGRTRTREEENGLGHLAGFAHSAEGVCGLAFLQKLGVVLLGDAGPLVHFRHDDTRAQGPGRKHSLDGVHTDAVWGEFKSKTLRELVHSGLRHAVVGHSWELSCAGGV